MSTVTANVTAQQLIDQLALEAHVEGGYFRRTYEAESDAHGRCPGTSIYYLLSTQSPTGHLHCNKSDIIHYYHAGAPIRYTLVDPQGELRQVIMGNRVERGELPQLMVSGGTWKASELIVDSDQAHDFGLISEAVIPGFNYSDMQLATQQDLEQRWPQHLEQLKHLIKTDSR